MGKLLALIALLIIPRLVLANDGTAREIYVPVEKALWRTASDGSAKIQAFALEEAFLGAGTEAKLSPDRKTLAFTRAGNVWLYEPISGTCTEVSGFPDCDPKEVGCRSLVLYGWSKDGKKLAVSTSYADYGPGEGEAPPKFTSLTNCRSVIRHKPGWTVPEDEESGETSNYGTFIMGVSTPTVLRLKSTDEAVAQVYPDGSYGGAAKSPDGKLEAYIRDPYAGKSELIVGDRVAVPGTKVRRFWWITDDAIAALSFSADQKSLELHVIRIPSLKVVGHHVQPRKH